MVLRDCFDICNKSHQLYNISPAHDDLTPVADCFPLRCVYCELIRATSQNNLLQIHDDSQLSAHLG